MNNQDEYSERWHLKKEVNLSIIGVLICQIIVAGIAWGNMENRVTQLERDREHLRTVPSQLASIESTLISIEKRLDRDDKK